MSISFVVEEAALWASVLEFILGMGPLLETPKEPTISYSGGPWNIMENGKCSRKCLKEKEILRFYIHKIFYSGCSENNELRVSLILLGSLFREKNMYVLKRWSKNLLKEKSQPHPSNRPVPNCKPSNGTPTLQPYPNLYRGPIPVQYSQVKYSSPIKRIILGPNTRCKDLHRWPCVLHTVNTVTAFYIRDIKSHEAT